MSRWTRYLERATELIDSYKGDTPLPPVLKEYFRGYPQMGSTDRRIVSDLVFSYYRLGRAGLSLPVGERLLLAYWMTHPGSSPLIEALRPEWVAASPGAPAGSPSPGAFVGDIFPWKDALSAGIDPLALSLSHLRQPDFYIRVRPGRMKEVRAALEKRGIPVEEVDAAASDLPAGSALRLPTGAPLQDILPADTAYVVQDLSSQRVGTLMERALRRSDAPRVWDCCAASGGKSLLLKDLCPEARLTVSDIRSSILHNLDKRFTAAGIRYERTLVADLSKPVALPGVFNLIVADVPCTGSGTWSRTPEQLFFFDPGTIGEFARLQRSILERVLPAVAPGGYLLLITCSVFAEENEAHTARLVTDGLELCAQSLFTGYAYGADTLFGALLRKRD